MKTHRKVSRRQVDTIPPKPKGNGFGSDQRSLILAKRPEYDPVADAHGYGGSDSAAVPEANLLDLPVPAADATPAAAPTSGQLTVSVEELRSLITAEAQKQAVSLNQSLQDQVNAMKADADLQAQRHSQTEQQLLQEADAARREVVRLQGVFSATGHSTPVGDQSGAASQRYHGFSVNTLLLPSRQEPQGAAKDFADILMNPQYTPRMQAFDPTDGMEYEQMDTTNLDRFVRENRVQVIRDMEVLMKAHGYLRGGDVRSRDAVAGNTLAVSGSIGDTVLPLLSSLMRLSHNPRYVFHQFVSARVELGRVPGNNILVPRLQWLDEPENPDDFIIDTADSSLNISSDNQALQALTTPIALLGWALGKGNRVGNRSVAIPEFVNATAFLDLLTAANSRLGQNYNALEDLIIRRIFQETLNNPANIYYGEGTNLTQTPLNINIGEDSTATEELFNQMFGEMTRRQIPTYDNGTRAAILTTYAATQFKNSLGDKLRANTEAEIQEITSILNAGALGTGLDKPSGYLGTYCNFMLFESGTTGVGVAGAAGTGVNTITTGAGARIYRDNYFFGPGVVGKGVSLPMEMRMDNSGTFGTKMRCIWRSIEGWGSLDCTSTNPGQLDRCLVLRTADQAI